MQKDGQGKYWKRLLRVLGLNTVQPTDPKTYLKTQPTNWPTNQPTDHKTDFKIQPTNRPTYQWTKPLIEMHVHDLIYL